MIINNDIFWYSLPDRPKYPSETSRPLGCVPSYAGKSLDNIRFGTPFLTRSRIVIWLLVHPIHSLYFPCSPFYSGCCSIPQLPCVGRTIVGHIYIISQVQKITLDLHKMVGDDTSKSHIIRRYTVILMGRPY